MCDRVNQLKNDSSGSCVLSDLKNYYLLSGQAVDFHLKCKILMKNYKSNTSERRYVFTSPENRTIKIHHLSW